MEYSITAFALSADKLHRVRHANLPTLSFQLSFLLHDQAVSHRLAADGDLHVRGDSAGLRLAGALVEKVRRTLRGVIRVVHSSHGRRCWIGVPQILWHVERVIVSVSRVERHAVVTRIECSVHQPTTGTATTRRTGLARLTATRLAGASGAGLAGTAHRRPALSG